MAQAHTAPEGAPPFYVVPRGTQSSTVGELAKALAKARANIKHPKRNQENSFFHNSYADLGAVIDAVVPAFAEQGLAVVQVVHNDALITKLIHTSGEWIEGSTPIKPDKTGPQAYGSCVTYMRRYALGALGGVHSEIDDDAEAAEVRAKPAAKAKPATKAKKGATKAKKPTPTQAAMADNAVKVEGAETKFFQAAKKLIESTEDVDAALIKVNNSTKLTDQEKVDLASIAKSRTEGK